MSSLLVFYFLSLISMNTKNNRNLLIPEESYIIEHKWTELPYTWELLDEHRTGTFVCKRCDSPLYYSDMKFDSGCWWPAFDDAITGQVKETPDEDGHRVEITCKTCWGHLWHIFRGEHLTDKNIRHCVNSVSMKFIPRMVPLHQHLEIATFGAWCFRCVEAVFQRLRWVETVTSGFMGGTSQWPSYEDICKRNTWHIEVIQLQYDPEIISYQTLLNVFFTSHDPTQLNAQGNDVGEQYASVIFYHTLEQKEQAEQMIAGLKESKVYHPRTIVTQIRQASDFWKAEWYHQDFYNNNQQKPYCELVINPKLAKLRKSRWDLLKDEYFEESD